MIARTTGVICCLILLCAAVHCRRIKKLTQTVEELKEQLEDLNNDIKELAKVGSRSSGSTYIRWGRNSCPDTGAVLVYNGSVAGSHYSHGGGSNYLCLPWDPDTNTALPARADSLRGLLYGAEYELGGSLQEREVPCAVCQVKAASTMMLPARVDCYDGWKLEYKGNLTSESYGHRRTEYVCLDSAPQTLGGTANSNGALFYYVEARIGSLPSPPYQQGGEVTCAVCSYNGK